MSVPFYVALFFVYAIGCFAFSVFIALRLRLYLRLRRVRSLSAWESDLDAKVSELQKTLIGLVFEWLGCLVLFVVVFIAFRHSH